MGVVFKTPPKSQSNQSNILNTKRTRTPSQKLRDAQQDKVDESKKNKKTPVIIDTKILPNLSKSKKNKNLKTTNKKVDKPSEIKSSISSGKTTTPGKPTKSNLKKPTKSKKNSGTLESHTLPKNKNDRKPNSVETSGSTSTIKTPSDT